MGPVPIPRHVEPYAVDSGRHDGQGTESRVSFSTAVASPNAAWLQLHFSAADLGQNSFVILTSAQDRGQQRLDARSLAAWEQQSAYFNGDRVDVELHVAPGDRGVFIKIAEITVGDWVGGQPGGGCSWSCGICSGDDRVPSNDPRVGRITSGCTGWIVSNGAHLTAGHCISGAGTLGMLHFNVPLSLCDGTIVNPPPEDQYPIPPSSIVGVNTSGGNDWAVFACAPNSNTGLLPAQAQAAFFRMTRDLIPPQSRVTGYGIDQSPPGCTGARNQFSQTQQTDTGFFWTVPDSSTIVTGADLTCGNSGGPIMFTDGSLGLGIVTRCTNSCLLDDNDGTGFENDDLEGALDTFPGPGVVYVDVGHPVLLEDGGVLRPYDRVPEAIGFVTAGGIVGIVAGSYTAAAGNTFTAGADGTAMTLVAPVGLVTIGN
jgi:hypothetical protein